MQVTTLTAGKDLPFKKNKPMKVILHKLFPYAPYLNEYIGFEKEIDIGVDSPLEVIKELRVMAEQAHKERYPNLYPNGNEEVVQGFQQQPIPEIDYSKKEKTEIAIDNCTTIEELNKIMNEAFQNGLVNEFISKKKQLPV